MTDDKKKTEEKKIPGFFFRFQKCACFGKCHSIKCLQCKNCELMYTFRMFLNICFFPWTTNRDTKHKEMKYFFNNGAF